MIRRGQVRLLLVPARGMFIAGLFFGAILAFCALGLYQEATRRGLSVWQVGYADLDEEAQAVWARAPPGRDDAGHPSRRWGLSWCRICVSPRGAASCRPSTCRHRPTSTAVRRRCR